MPRAGRVAPCPPVFRGVMQAWRTADIAVDPDRACPRGRCSLEVAAPPDLPTRRGRTPDQGVVPAGQKRTGPAPGRTGMWCQGSSMSCTTRPSSATRGDSTGQRRIPVPTSTDDVAVADGGRTERDGHVAGHAADPAHRPVEGDGGDDRRVDRSGRAARRRQDDGPVDHRRGDTGATTDALGAAPVSGGTSICSAGDDAERAEAGQVLDRHRGWRRHGVRGRARPRPPQPTGGGGGRRRVARRRRRRWRRRRHAARGGRAAGRGGHDGPEPAVVVAARTRGGDERHDQEQAHDPPHVVDDRRSVLSGQPDAGRRQQACAKLPAVEALRGSPGATAS